MAYTPPYLTQPGPRSSFTEYFPCDYCKGPLGADSTAHCRGCGAPLQAIPPLFNVTVLQHWDWQQQNLGNRQIRGLENSLGHRTGIASMLLGGLR